MTREMDDAVYQLCQPAARLRVTGADASVFLQGQFSNDLRRAEPLPATYGLWLNHKGRPLADSHVLQRGPNDFEIVSRTSPAAMIRERLETYVIADEVEVEDLTESCAGLLVGGVNASRAVEALGLSAPVARHFSEREGCLALAARCDVRPSWLVVLPAAQAEAGRAALGALGVREVEGIAFDRLRIHAGIPVVPHELGPDDLPAEGGLDHDAVSFTKGCYLGQEVMARLHNLGQVRRRLFVVRIEPQVALPGKGTLLFAGGQKLGEMRSAVALADSTGGGAIGLAMLQVHAVQPGLALSLAPGAEATVRVERLAEGRAP